MDEQKESGFKVTDRRKFNADGTPRDVDVVAEPPAPAIEEPQPQNQQEDAGGTGKVVSFPGETGKKKDQSESRLSPAAVPNSGGASRLDEKRIATNSHNDAAERAYKQANRGRPSELPEATFASLVNMLAVEAAMSLGLINNPMGGGAVIDLESARHLVDLLGVLYEKTRGNLTEEEDGMFENILTDLRMQFVVASNRR